MRGTSPSGSSPSEGAEAGARLLAMEFAAAGYRHHHPQGLNSDSGDPVLFTHPASPAWRRWMLAELPRAGGGAVVVQWCVRATRLDSLPVAAPPSAERVVGAVWQGRRAHAALLDELLRAFVRAGVDPLDISFLLSGHDRSAGQPVADALHGLGVPAHRVVHGALPAAAPQRMEPELGLCVTFRVAVGPPCSAGCAPDCPCGRHLSVAHCQFVERDRAADGRVVALRRPVFEVLVPEHALLCALFSTRDPYALPAMRSLMGRIAAVLPGRSAFRDRHARVLADHSFTSALLLGEGTAPGPRGRPYVLRRLVRRAATELRLAQAPLPDLVGLIASADHLNRVPMGFPPLRDNALMLARREVASVSRVFNDGYIRFLRHARDARDPADTARDLVRLRSEHGVPLALALAWCREEGLEVPLARVAAADLDSRTERRATGGAAAAAPWVRTR